jgi:predicted nuclease with TOPRIM domain
MGMESLENIRERIAQLEKELKQLRSQFPKHSIKPSMIMQMDELEDELESLNKKMQQRSSK